jgi:hypothetical protein
MNQQQSFFAPLQDDSLHLVVDYDDEWSSTLKFLKSDEGFCGCDDDDYEDHNDNDNERITEFASATTIPITASSIFGDSLILSGSSSDIFDEDQVRDMLGAWNKSISSANDSFANRESQVHDSLLGNRRSNNGDHSVGLGINKTVPSSPPLMSRAIDEDVPTSQKLSSVLLPSRPFSAEKSLPRSVSVDDHVVPDHERKPRVSCGMCSLEWRALPLFLEVIFHPNNILLTPFIVPGHLL